MKLRERASVREKNRYRIGLLSDVDNGGYNKKHGRVGIYCDEGCGFDNEGMPNDSGKTPIQYSSSSPPSIKDLRTTNPPQDD